MENDFVLWKASETLVLLHIDDSENDRFLVREAISLTQTPFAFYEADGLESAKPFFDCSDPKRFPNPAALLLDYQLGNHTGADVLHWLRVVRNITSVPVVMFSGSLGHTRVARCYEAGANCFLSKPGDLERLKMVVRMLYLNLVTGLSRPIQLLTEFQPDPRKAEVLLAV